MNWKLKIAAYKTLSALPGGRKVYRFCPERISRSVRPTPERINQKIGVGLQYWDWLKTNGRAQSVIGGSHLDFGAGWFPIIPLLFYSLGVEKQFLFDVTPLLDEPLVVETIRLFRDIVSDPTWSHRADVRRLPENPSRQNGPWETLLSSLGIRYVAPYFGEQDAVRESINLVTSTQVLLHIERNALAECFRLIKQTLKKDGLFTAVVHLRDPYSDADRSISPYNHLKYSPWVWEHLINSPLMSHNRLKARDYRELLDAAGFRILHFEVNAPNQEDLRQLERIRVHPSFSAYSKEELVAKHLFFVAQEP